MSATERPSAAHDALSKAPSPSNRIWLWVAIGVAAFVVLVVVILLVRRSRRRRRAARQVDPGDRSLAQALSTADARLRQISDYATKYRANVGPEAQSRLEEAKRYLAAAHGREASNEQEAIAYANGASTLAAQAQTLANADVLAAHRTRR